jgi:succinate dehydrogenase/fumarate reductase flavoprotein subunit
LSLPVHQRTCGGNRFAGSALQRSSYAGRVIQTRATHSVLLQEGLQANNEAATRAMISEARARFASFS